MMNNIPVIIIHTGYKEYLRKNCEITGVNNNIYLIGDESVKVLEELPNVTFINIDKYRISKDINHYKKHFTNYSSNSSQFEFYCFERVFILKKIMEEFGFSAVFHIDSDNVLLKDVNEYNFKKSIGFIYPNEQHENRMSASIHVSLLTIEFCNTFNKLYEDIYVNKNRLGIIEKKIEFHRNKITGRYQGGGICDMTFYYILYQSNLLDVQNLLEPMDGYVFMHCINNSEGDLKKKQINMSNHMQELNFNSNYLSVYDTIRKQPFKLMNIHFQGTAKHYLEQPSMCEKLINIAKNASNAITLHGTNYGGFYYPKKLPNLDENSIIYCFGAGEDITHDVVLSSKLNCKVNIFDPLPRAIEYVKYVKNLLGKNAKSENNKKFGGGDPNYWNLILNNPAKPENLILHEYGLYTEDDILNFYLPDNSQYISCSLDKRGKSDNYIQLPVKTLNTIMKELNHSHIDLLKISVENVECDILEKMLNDKIHPRYISVDFQLINTDKPRCYENIKKIMVNNYKILKKEGQHMTFISQKKI